MLRVERRATNALAVAATVLFAASSSACSLTISVDDLHPSGTDVGVGSDSSFADGSDSSVGNDTGTRDTTTKDTFNRDDTSMIDTTSIDTLSTDTAPPDTTVDTPDGPCDPGVTYCSFVCLDLTIDAHHCGSCTKTCADDQKCSASTCVCRGGLTACGTSCVDLMGDAARCGSCTTMCAATDRCISGTCTAPTGGGPSCPTGRSECSAASGRSCFDLKNDSTNCGGCGNRCDFREVCVAGMCERYRPAVGGCSACDSIVGGPPSVCCPLAGGKAYCVQGTACPVTF